ncbi:MAG: hypothetical protein GWM90_23520, partial [Gemmatimonadetes bacterium]|nr:hypothetical protein [Gemmatimonadota bacterium]NIQ57641.1 hypothetical protein [Gemmatimonadota bacterium]NIU77808.1 hypothetical protein [Gammaproteobacteria bacterium]NIX46940.1 hypothetical protein [Gemmatimonadota bacterium]NIY11289.1 hypothetical protein [Gemmatimonadota bacterium]
MSFDHKNVLTSSERAAARERTAGRARLAAVGTALAVLGASGVGAQQQTAPPQVGPENGSLVVVGGAMRSPEIYQRFIELAGGPDAHIV